MSGGNGTGAWATLFCNPQMTLQNFFLMMAAAILIISRFSISIDTKIQSANSLACQVQKQTLLNNLLCTVGICKHITNDPKLTKFEMALKWIFRLAVCLCIIVNWLKIDWDAQSFLQPTLNITWKIHQKWGLTRAAAASQECRANTMMQRSFFFSLLVWLPFFQFSCLKMAKKKRATRLTIHSLDKLTVLLTLAKNPHVFWSLSSPLLSLYYARAENRLSKISTFKTNCIHTT